MLLIFIHSLCVPSSLLSFSHIMSAFDSFPDLAAQVRTAVRAPEQKTLIKSMAIDMDEEIWKVVLRKKTTNALDSSSASSNSSLTNQEREAMKILTSDPKAGDRLMKAMASEAAVAIESKIKFMKNPPTGRELTVHEVKCLMSPVGFIESHQIPDAPPSSTAPPSYFLPGSNRTRILLLSLANLRGTEADPSVAELGRQLKQSLYDHMSLRNLRIMNAHVRDFNMPATFQKTQEITEQWAEILKQKGDDKKQEMVKVKLQSMMNLARAVDDDFLTPEYADRELVKFYRTVQLMDAALWPSHAAYTEWFDSAVVHRCVIPDNIATVIRSVADASDSLLIISFSHGAETIQANYDWHACLQPIQRKLDGIIFVACKAIKTIYPRIQDLPILVWAIEKTITASDLNSSAVDAVRNFAIVYLAFTNNGDLYSPATYRLFVEMAKKQLDVDKVEFTEEEKLYYALRSDLRQLYYEPPLEPLARQMLMVHGAKVANYICTQAEERIGVKSVRNDAHSSSISRLHWVNVKHSKSTSRK